jgi:hypothetical protein
MEIVRETKAERQNLVLYVTLQYATAVLLVVVWVVINRCWPNSL